MLAGAGDELQGIKKGIIEMADLLVIHKADGDNIKASELARRQYSNALHLFPEPESGWSPQVTTASSYENKGIDEIWKTMSEYKDLVQNSGYFESNRKQQQIQWMHNNVYEELKRLFYSNSAVKNQLKILEEKILQSEISPVKAAEIVIEEFKRNL